MSRTSNQLRRAMSGTLSEFHRLDAIERAATKAALDRCRALADQVEKDLLKVRAEDFHDLTVLAEFEASLESASEVLRRPTALGTASRKPTRSPC
jgi:hypothetical protein